MITPSTTVAARLAAKLLAHRPTPTDEVGDLIRSVHGALLRLGEAPAAVEPLPEEEHPEAPIAAPVRRRRRPARAQAVEPAIEETPVPPPAPKLVRRAEVAATPAPVTTSLLAPPPGHGLLRGVVRWFDPKSGKGMVRLPGHGDVGFEARLLADSGISRLFKGQEIEATLAEGAPARLQRLGLPGGGGMAGSVFGSGTVKSRHAKPVVVEMKREALRRAAARAEAEHVLGSNRNR